MIRSRLYKDSRETGSELCTGQGRTFDSTQEVTCYLVLDLHLKDDSVFRDQASGEHLA